VIGLELVALLSLLIALACSLLVIRSRDLLSGAILLGAVGFLIAWVFFALRAPDLGVVQLLTEVIKMCVLVIVVSKTRRIGFSVEPRRRRMVLALSLGVVYIFFLLFALPAMSPFGEQTSELARDYARLGWSETGSMNMVTSILLGFRAYDTVVEVCVLFASIVGVTVLLKRERRVE